MEALSVNAMIYRTANAARDRRIEQRTPMSDETGLGLGRLRALLEEMARS